MQIGSGQQLAQFFGQQKMIALREFREKADSQTVQKIINLMALEEAQVHELESLQEPEQLARLHDICTAQLAELNF